MQQTKSVRGRKGQKGSSKHDVTFMRHLAQTYIEGDQSFNQLSLKYGVPNQTICRWVQKFSSELRAETNSAPMTEQEQKDMAALQKQVGVLKKKLEFEQMRNFALETMADLAKTELGIDIRKNYGAKQPKE